MITQYLCKNKNRRQVVRDTKENGNPIANGIDYLEVDPDDQKILRVYFIHNFSDVPPAEVLSKDKVIIEGGERIKGIQVVDPFNMQDNILTVNVDRPGDFSTYTLCLVKSATDKTPPDGFDPQLSAIDFSFKVNCPSDFDCKLERICPPKVKQEPDINYLAKDYASFRQLMLDHMSLLLPDWKERNAADLGIALVELLAYVGDHLSYQQDAIATEAYLGTARKRVSVRRHARLVDYQMHDGCNARVWVALTVDSTSDDKVLQGPSQKEDRAGTIMLTKVNESGCLLEKNKLAAALRDGALVFETMHDLTLYESHNEMYFYTWGDEECCLPKGAIHAFLRDDKNKRLRLRPGDVLIFEEVRGPETGRKADANPTFRHAVRLTEVCPEALLYKDNDGKRSAGAILEDRLTAQAYVEIKWSDEDALPFPLCLHDVKDPDKKDNKKYPVSVACGNIVLADHGMTMRKAPIPNEVPKEGRYYPYIANGPLTFAENFDTTVSASSALKQDLRKVCPVIELIGEGEAWHPQYDLLSSDKFKKEFVVEMESDGIAYLRFGGDVLGKKPRAGADFKAEFRVGNGRAGNVGAETITHIVTNMAGIEKIWNPLPGVGGTDPESIEYVRQAAPWAFRTQERAVTPEDYAKVAQRHKEVQRAVATFRWTGSWHTVFVTIDRFGGWPSDRDEKERFKKSIRNHLEKYRMAGYDLEVDGPLFVSLEIEMNICVKPDHFRSDVKEALLQVLSKSTLPDGRRGIFHPDNFTFGQTVYVSPIIAAAQAVDGVDSVKITKFQKQGIKSNEALDAGKLILGRLEIARLDNDANYPEHGILNINVEGGK